MSQLRNTIIEQNFPAIRRKSLTHLTNLIKNASFITHLVQQSKKNSKPSLKESQEAICSHFNRIHHIIDTIDEHISRRLQNHQNQVFSLVKMEIEEMREQTRLIVDKLNAAIAQKNTEDQIWNLNNQLDYFKSQTYQLFKENKKAKEDYTSLKKKLQEMQVQIQSNGLVMQKLKRQYLKQNMIKDKIVTLVKQKISIKSNITTQQIDNILKLQKIRPSSRMKTQPISQTRSKSGQFFQSRVQVNVDNNEIDKQSKVIIHLNNRSLYDQSSKSPIPQQKVKSPSILSSLNQQSQSELPELPPVKFVRVQSQYTQMPQMISFKMLKKVERGIQTEPLPNDQQASKTTSRQNAVKMFSNTSYVDLRAQQKQKKKLDLTKNGFFVRSYNQKMDKLAIKTEHSSQLGLKKQKRHMRYLSNVMNKSKMGICDQQVRGSTNKSCLK